MSQKRILVVDDREDNRRILGYRLRTIGDFEVLMATNGQEALEMALREPPDLIFMDLKLPVMDGWEAACRIREMEGPVRDVPIIALTDQGFCSEERVLALAAGCNDFISEPFITRSIIQEKVEHFLANGTGSYPLK